MSRPARSPATAGAGLGVIVGVIATVSLSVVLYRRHMRQRTARLYGIPPERVVFRCGPRSWVRDRARRPSPCLFVR
jgi:hypothetical protein